MRIMIHIHSRAICTPNYMVAYIAQANFHLETLVLSSISAVAKYVFMVDESGDGICHIRQIFSLELKHES